MIKFSQYITQQVLLILSMFFIVVSVCYEILYKNNMSFPEGENNIIFALDVSQSMNVTDRGDFNRLNIAKRKIIDIIDKNPGNNYGLNIFAGESMRILPFTQDTLLISTFLLGLDSRNITKQGSDIPSALVTSSESFNDFQSGKVILISDGSDEVVDISRDIRDMYRNKNLELIVLGVGTPSGGFIPSESPLSPYKIYNNQRVISSLNSESLVFVADELGGTYMHIDDFSDYEIIGEGRAKEGFSYVFLLFIATWCTYLVIVYRHIFLKHII